MKVRIDMDKIAKGLGAERRGKVAASGGYFGALAVCSHDSCGGLRRSRDKEPWSPTRTQPPSRLSIVARLPAWNGLISRRLSRARPSCMSSVSSTFAPACMEAAQTTQSHS